MGDKMTMEGLQEAATGFERSGQETLLDEASKPFGDPKLTRQFIRGGTSRVPPDKMVVPEEDRKRLHDASLRVEKLLDSAADKLDDAIGLLKKLDPHGSLVDPKQLNKLEVAAVDAANVSRFAKSRGSRYAKKGVTWKEAEK